MNRCSPLKTGPIWAEADDPRITPAGRFLRGAHIDELPQLVNVILRHMSLIGPRPERPELIPDLEDRLHRYGDRLQVLPGITGSVLVKDGNEVWGPLIGHPDRKFRCKGVTYDSYSFSR